MTGLTSKEGNHMVFDPSKPITPENTTAEPPAVPAAPASVAAPEPVPDKVVELTQSKLDTIVKTAMGRAAAELRRENLKLKAALDAQLKANNPDSTELEKTRAQLQAVQLRLEDLTAERANALLDAEVISAANSEHFVDAQQALLLLDRQSFVKDDGSVDTEAAKAAVKALAEKSPHLIRGVVKSGSGSTPANNPPQPPVKLESLFGRNSNAAEANALAIRDPQMYSRLRTEARRRGLI
jgi:hypothetical protein